MDERYPIGTFQHDGGITNEQVEKWITQIEELPQQLRQAVDQLTDQQLETPYRPGGWTVRQVVHHLADSHMNAFIRFKLAMTEERPLIKPYNEGAWARLSDSSLPVEPSLKLIEALHVRLVTVLRSLTQSDRKRIFIHPDSGEVSLGKNIGLYAWHGRHHLAHIKSTI
ncbi:putative metal-dependent hydrolase [Metabacillus sp. KIGAM252]|uniref:Putative metal-dependent hydrolase J9317_02020 n=1 Tax=Metabacillus flavus TaxID=2823519 RepID=A0ABS5LAR6_9BACI|nr:putative metal-dependent hydrolase [Metabacillus flavus]MBS2967549.1 putative metal-dependent hydrolase [Metabacillus flavus]